MRNLLGISVLLVYTLCGLCIPASAVVYVKVDSPGPAFDGTSWGTAFHTIQEGINAAAAKPGGDEVWVAACADPPGAYVENITLKEDVHLYGGFVGGETQREQRDWEANETIIDGNQAGSVVTAEDVDIATIDGFTIRNGSGTLVSVGGISIGYWGGGIYCYYNSSPSISNNTITGNSATWCGGGICCYYNSSPSISNNTITGNSATSSGGGICCSSSSPSISNNTITANSAGEDGGGIWCYSSSPSISSNTITANSADGYGDGIYLGLNSSPTISGNRIALNTGEGIYCESGESVISDNVISANSATGVTCSGDNSLISNVICGNTEGVRCKNTDTVANNIVSCNRREGILCIEGWPTITSNTIVGNWQGVRHSSGASSHLSNNIIAFNVIGISTSGTSSLPSLWRNNVYGNVEADYDGLPAGLVDMSRDPQFMSLNYGDLHIASTSPCRDAGDSLVEGLQSTDVDGQPRIDGLAVDIGADESYGEDYAGNRVIYVDASAAVGGDGAGWDSAYSVLQDALDDTVFNGGAEIWVASGTYHEQVTLWPFAHVYGGFTATEETRESRRPRDNVTVIDAGNPAGYSYVVDGANHATLDGFTIRGGYYGVLCGETAPDVSHNVITDNWLGVYVYGYNTPKLRNNVIVENGVGVYCSDSDPVIVNNTFSDNSGSGLYFVSSSRPVVANNIIAFASYGVYNYGGDPQMFYNNVFGNTEDYVGVGSGIGDISVDPLFVDRVSGNYHLTANSPCREAGWNGAPWLPTTDFDLQSRIWDAVVDIGADEYSDAPIEATTIRDAKRAADGTRVQIDGAVVTAAFDGFFYVETDDRSCGIRVEKAEHGLAVGDRTDVVGTVQTNSDGERYIDATSVTLSGTGSVGPLGMTNLSIGGGPFGLQQGITGCFGLSNIGLLVRTCGRVTSTGADEFTIDDGSGVDVKCIVPTGVTLPDLGQYVGVTGISSCEQAGPDLRRLIRVRDSGDINML